MIERNPNVDMRAANREPRGEATLPAPACSTTGTHIRFDELTPNPATKRWAVMPKDGSQQIGTVSWYGPWRKYCFFPMAATVFEQVCLKEIACFIEGQTQLHRTAKSSNGELSRAGENPKP